MTSKGQLLADYVAAMINGEVPTQRDFVCPGCGGTAHIGARWVKPGWLGVSAWCRACPTGSEIDLGEGWPGYEAILVDDESPPKVGKQG